MKPPRTDGRRRRHRAPRTRSRGISLIEVMVAVLVLAFGLMGLVALQTRALRANVSAMQRSQAVVLAQYMLEAMRVDREQARLGRYDTGDAFTCLPAGMTSQHPLAQASLRRWLADVKANIGEATDTSTCARVKCQSTYLCTVDIQWDDRVDGGLPLQQLSLSSRL